MKFTFAAGMTVLPFLTHRFPALCEEPPTNEKIRGIYENKIRFFGAPEKIFETFATIKKETGLVMSYNDFFRSITPYNYHPARSNPQEYFDKFKPEILELADINKDGFIDFPEFFFFVTILQLPEKDIRRAFKKTNPQTLKMSPKAFSSTLTHLRKHTLMGKKQMNKTIMPDARMITAKEEDFLATNAALTKIIFKGKSEIGVEELMDIKKNLQ
jgi:Ca2+-binding EF-hand superfamily protein